MIENNSGYLPVGHAVLIWAFELDEKRGLVHVPDNVRKSSATTDIEGIVVAIGADCWNGANETPRAKVGDQVLITYLSGGMLPKPGKDGRIYRMVPDHAIYAVKKD